MMHESKNRGVLLDSAQLCWIVQDDPHHASSQQARKRRSTWWRCFNFPWTLGGEGAVCGMRRDSGEDSRQSVADIPPGPPVTGHPVIHDSVAPGAPLLRGLLDNQQRRNQVGQNLQEGANVVTKNRGSGSAAKWRWLDRGIDAKKVLAPLQRPQQKDLKNKNRRTGSHWKRFWALKSCAPTCKNC